MSSISTKVQVAQPVPDPLKTLSVELIARLSDKTKEPPLVYLDPVETKGASGGAIDDELTEFIVTFQPPDPAASPWEFVFDLVQLEALAAGETKTLSLWRCDVDPDCGSRFANQQERCLVCNPVTSDLARILSLVGDVDSPIADPEPDPEVAEPEAEVDADPAEEAVSAEFINESEEFLKLLLSLELIELEDEPIAVEHHSSLGSILNQRFPELDERVKAVWDWFMNEDGIAEVFASEREMRHILKRW